MRKFGAKAVQTFFMHAFSENFVYVLDFHRYAKVREGWPARAGQNYGMRHSASPARRMARTNGRRLIGDTISENVLFFS